MLLKYLFVNFLQLSRHKNNGLSPTILNIVVLSNSWKNSIVVHVKNLLIPLKLNNNNIYTLKIYYFYTTF